MELEEFVSEVLTQIVENVKASQQGQDERDRVIFARFAFAGC